MDVQNIRSKRGAVKVFHSLIKIPHSDRHEWQLRPGLCRTCFYKFLPSCHEEEKLYDTPMQDKPLSLIFASQKFCQVLNFIWGKSLFGSSYRAGYWSVKQLVPIQLQNSGIAGGFHQIFYGTTHFLTPKMACSSDKKALFLAGGMKNLCIHIPSSVIWIVIVSSVPVYSAWNPSAFSLQGKWSEKFLRKHKKNHFAFFVITLSCWPPSNSFNA